MKIAVICEFSGVVRDAFARLGHEAISFDLLPSERPGLHIQGDVRDLPYDYWKQFDLAVCHPECRYLAASGARWFNVPGRKEKQEQALKFVQWCMDLPIQRIAIENPVGIISTRIRKPNQIIQPWQFGHGEVKATCLWLKGLEPLNPTQVVDGRKDRVWRMPPSPERWKERSRTFYGIAIAMAEQWGCLVQN